ncbi:CsxC family protein [Clostridium tetanomorphum]|uniref:CsxC family protein n=1 Tax=Clostridium tetanomorphum TaxID=1553 RepID=UPI00157141D7|nr:hypothetical protein [Clostridium tetanomorphum]NRZ98884.1 hypothetical protein [Clostridium tetanomorphum]
MAQDNIISASANVNNSYVINEGKEVAQCTPQCTPKCDSKLSDSTTLTECDNKYRIPMGRTGPLIVKVPVVLSDVEVQVDLESEIRLDENALDIKTIDKNICLTQCKLIPYTNKLFIGGYVQKNIQYSTIDCTNKTSISGNIQHTTINIPFKCVTKIKFSKQPIYGKYYKEKLNALDKNMMCKDSKEDSWIHYNKLYEPVYCELEYAKILETDILDRKCRFDNKDTNEKTFQEIIEKMVVFIRLKVLQKQQIYIPEPVGDVTILEDCDFDFSCKYIDCKDEESTYIEVGVDSKKDMIGREVSINDFHID